MDWPPLLDFLRARTRLPDHEQLAFSFITTDPGVAHRRAWLEVHAQQRSLEPSRVQVKADPARAAIEVTSDNVERLRLDRPLLMRALALGPQQETALVIDGQRLALSAAAGSADAPAWWLERDPATGRWSSTGAPDRLLKSPERGSRVLQALRQRLLLVVGTAGSAQENEAQLDTARYLAEQFAYRGNAGLRIVSDEQFIAGQSSREFDGRNLLLIGNADTHHAWQMLLGASPVQVQRGRVNVGRRQLNGDDLAGAFVRPRPGGDGTAVIALAGSGVVGLRAAARLPLAAGSLGLADWIVLGADALTRGWDGIRGTGFFDNRWQLSPVDSAWR